MDDRGGKTEYRLSSVVRLLRMRIQISHLTNYRYDAPAASVIHMLRLTPRNHDGQYVARWRIDVSTDCRLDQHEDAFGNITHVFTADGPLTELAVAVEGEVETRDTQGIVRGVVERFPPNFYLRETALTTPDVNIAGFAAAQQTTLGQQARPSRTMNGAIHSASTQQRTVGRVDDRVDRLPGYVSLKNLNGTAHNLSAFKTVFELIVGDFRTFRLSTLE